MNELKHCPFCGGEAIVYGRKYDWYTPSCRSSGCGCDWTESYATEAEAIAAWNTRAERTAKPVDYPSRDYGFTYEAGDNEEYYGAFCGCSECGNFVPMRKYCMECGARFEVVE